MNTTTVEIGLTRIRDLITAGDFEPAIDCAEALLEYLRRLLKPIAVDDLTNAPSSASGSTYEASNVPGGFGRVRNTERLVAQIVNVLVSGHRERARENVERALTEWRSYLPTN